MHRRTSLSRLVYSLLQLLSILHVNLHMVKHVESMFTSTVVWKRVSSSTWWISWLSCYQLASLMIVFTLGALMHVCMQCNVMMSASYILLQLRVLFARHHNCHLCSNSHRMCTSAMHSHAGSSSLLATCMSCVILLVIIISMLSQPNWVSVNSVVSLQVSVVIVFLVSATIIIICRDMYRVCRDNVLHRDMFVLHWVVMLRVLLYLLCLHNPYYHLRKVLNKCLYNHLNVIWNVGSIRNAFGVVVNRLVVYKILILHIEQHMEAGGKGTLPVMKNLLQTCYLSWKETLVMFLLNPLFLLIDPHTSNIVLI